uniref:Uncharacterized protein n=1 Tax=Pyrodinium bahamense TaxID=73915 RepID=A0A7R9ZXN9_9DINO|mmetsp:Transcript_14153/g.39181  ORF Transcript_14153/g.39181 Transcript_14153/m.39181 type:complete len:108 (+) Transcript_14153:75-398(+)
MLGPSHRPGMAVQKVLQREDCFQREGPRVNQAEGVEAAVEARRETKVGCRGAKALAAAADGNREDRGHLPRPRVQTLAEAAGVEERASPSDAEWHEERPARARQRER